MKFDIAIDNDMQGLDTITVLNMVEKIGFQDAHRILGALRRVIQDNNLPVTVYAVDEDGNTFCTPGELSERH